MSGHATLKSALLLRDAIAASIGLRLEDAMRALADVEEELGATRAFEEGHWRDALRARVDCVPGVLDGLDTTVRDACGVSGFTPRYPQYLALLMFARWMELRFSDEDVFLRYVNTHVDARRQVPSSRRSRRKVDDGDSASDIEPFTIADLQTVAFWMATAAGKTHVLHACLAMLVGERRWNRIFIVTPSESLSRQHAKRLSAFSPPARLWNVFMYPDDGDATTMSQLSVDTIIVIDINKLGEEVSGDGQRVPLGAFSDGANLVFVDEGHKGQKSEAGLWKRLQRDLAGIGNSQRRHQGLLVEFSATFGQVAEAEHAFSQYSKSILFDYAYDRFHADLYGKDFSHVRIDERGEGEAAAEMTLAAALLSYWSQRCAWETVRRTPNAVPAGLRLHDPLWVLLGLHVTGGKSAKDREQTADVLGVIRWFHTVLADPAVLARELDTLKVALAGAAISLPTEALRALREVSPLRLAQEILCSVFGWREGAKPMVRVIAEAGGELALGTVAGSHQQYYGVVSVGDVQELRARLRDLDIQVGNDAFTPSLFAQLSQENSGVNVLLGSRRFAEGWDNYRASSLTLLKLGQKEGSLIVQMFGRMIRFAGVNGDGKRLARPSDVIAPLQTAYIFGLRSRYLEDFVAELKANGVEQNGSVTCTFHPSLPEHAILRMVRAAPPSRESYRVEAIGERWLNAVTSKVRVSVGVSMVNARMHQLGIDSIAMRIADDVTPEFRAWTPLIDYDEVYLALVERRRTSAQWNLVFDRGAVVAALGSELYEVQGVQGVFSDDGARDRVHRLAVSIVDQLFGKLSRKRESAGAHYFMEDPGRSLPKTYRKECFRGS